MSDSKECGEYKLNGWHLKKEVTIGQLLTTILILVSGLWWASSVETRIEKLNLEDHRIEQKTDIVLKNMNDRFDRYQVTVKDALADIKDGIDRVEDKLDKKADK